MKKKNKFQKIERIYRWETLLDAPLDNPAGDNVFANAEKELYASGLHSKLVKSGNKYILKVRSSEYEYAKALVDGDVSEIINTPFNKYSLFQDNMEYINDKFQLDTSVDRRTKLNMRRNLIFMILGILIFAASIYFFS